MGFRWPLWGVALTVVAIVIGWAGAESTARAAMSAPAGVSSTASAEDEPVSGALAQDESADGNDPVPVQVWTIVAAAGAALLGLLLFALRWALGLVKPPPEPRPEEHR